jgi:hypothetical protein
MVYEDDNILCSGSQRAGNPAGGQGKETQNLTVTTITIIQ